MSIYKDGKLIAGGSQALPLLCFMWSDHQLNHPSWLNSTTFSWQSGAVYQAVYAHLRTDTTGKTLQSETISGTTIQFYLADDGHKICPASQESNVLSIYNATGVAWYYIIDTTNQRFKLPRTKFGVTGIRSGVGNYVEAGLPNITGSSYGYVSSANRGASGALKMSGGSAKDATGGGGWWVEGVTVSVDASASNSIYGASDTVQPKATEMYLYFYVGNFTQTALENTAGVTTETLNDKLDLDLGNATSTTKETVVGFGSIDWSSEVNITSNATYTCPCDGYLRLYCTYNGYAYYSSSLDTHASGFGWTYNAVGTGRAAGGFFRVSKGEVLTKGDFSGGSAYFLPCKGVV